jgi:hypothetical protein
MNWPRSIEVIVEGYDKEQKGILLREMPFAPDIAEYQIEDGSKFCIDAEYLSFCRENKKPPHIPEQVIRENRARAEKLARGQAELAKIKKQQDTGLILPDGFKV